VSARIVCIGECMVELRERPDGTLTRGHGGDTLNTAVYLARLGERVDYATALGDDPWSDEMVRHWREEGIGTSLVRRIANRLPGLYVIQTDAAGERRFVYWRDSAAARMLFDLPDVGDLIDTLSRYDLLYFSGITLSIYGDAGRAALFAAIDAARERGGRVAFDTNFRPRGWPDRDIARAVYREALARADVVLASTEDLEPLFGPDGADELAVHASDAECVLKFAHPAVRIGSADAGAIVAAPPVANVIDTTAAGDSFAAAYLAARLRGLGPAESAAAGHRLAGIVVRHHGAVIPRDAMPTDILLPTALPHEAWTP
jgi:2-dehydro-3-deoxygluconokinase